MKGGQEGMWTGVMRAVKEVRGRGEGEGTSHETSARGMLALLRNSSLAIRLPD
jgi:hypothetical protein